MKIPTPPRSIIEQSSLWEVTTGDHNIQRDTNSMVKVFTAAVETEPNLTTTKAQANSATSKYEASEGSADNASIFSLSDSLSSKSSLHNLLGLSEEFASMLMMMQN
jgi:hypothetical protein